MKILLPTIQTRYFQLVICEGDIYQIHAIEYLSMEFNYNDFTTLN